MRELSPNKNSSLAIYVKRRNVNGKWMTTCLIVFSFCSSCHRLAVPLVGLRIKENCGSSKDFDSKSKQRKSATTVRSTNAHRGPSSISWRHFRSLEIKIYEIGNSHAEGFHSTEQPSRTIDCTGCELWKISQRKIPMCSPLCGENK